LIVGDLWNGTGIEMTTVLSPPEQKIILSGVSWQTYERLLEDLVENSASRLTYDRGTLEIMSPSAEHEEINRTIALLVEVVAEEQQVDIRSLGSTTFRREDLERGFEPDSCFYIKNLDQIEGKIQIDLAVDPPPDLVIEIDITSPSIDKFPIFAQADVPEIWHYDGRELVIYELLERGYKKRNQSLAFTEINSVTISSFIRDSQKMRRTAWLHKLREWIRA
jgi:Uma2 family endonuclease